MILAFKMILNPWFVFDPQMEKFEVLPLPSDHSNVRQINGPPGEVWQGQSGLDKLIVIRTGD